MKKRIKSICFLVLTAAVILLSACKDNSADITENNESHVSSGSFGSEISENEIYGENESQAQSSEESGLNTQSDSESLAVHRHRYESKITAPTCTENGYTLKSCSCGSVEKTDIVAPLGHSFDEWKTVIEATVNDGGLQTRTCSRCGETEEKTTPKKIQNSVDWRIQVMTLVNGEREKVGLAPLQYYEDGQKAADIRSQEIKTEFSHTRPNGETCFTVLDELNIKYKKAGENIAHGYDSPEAVVEGWMNSEGHRSNILNPDYTHIIVGVQDYNWVQLFISI